MTADETLKVCGFRLNAGSFSTHDLTTISNGGEFFILVKPVFYHAQDGRLFQIPKGAQSDGISAPKCAAALGRSAGGNDWAAGWLHDAAYRNTLLVWTGVWQNARLTQAEADALLKECALACGDSELEAETLYLAVKQFGKTAFDEDR